MAGGAAQEIVKKTWSQGEKWLDVYFKDHQPNAIKKSKENALDFLIDLGNRISELEKISDEVNYKKRLSEALSDPDFSAVLQDAIIASARTSSKDKHQLLARAVSEKLTHQPESLESLLFNRTIEIIPNLPPKLLNMLAMQTAIIFSSTIFSKKTQNEKILENYLNFLSSVVEKICPLEVNKLELDYLESNSCISIYSDSRPLKRILFENIEFGNVEDIDSFLASEKGIIIEKFWNDIKHRQLTPPGTFLGFFVLEENGFTL